MVSKKAIISLSAVAIAAIIIVFFVVSYQASPSGKTIWNSVIEPKITYKAVLNVNSQVSNSYWARNLTTDLPDYVNEIVCYVRNTGNTAASNVNLEIKVDGNVLTTRYFPSIPIEAVETYSFSLTMPYDSTRNLFMYASCSDSDDSFSFSIEGKFPRYFNENSDITKLFITPKEANVVSLENRILKDKLFIIPNWIAIRDWVGNNIQYREDTGGAGTIGNLPKKLLVRELVIAKTTLSSYAHCFV